MASVEITEQQFRQQVLDLARLLGWRCYFTCSCGEAPTPAIVLGPFAGSGTVLSVAKSLGRKAIGIDISEEYVILAKERCEQVSLPLRL